MPAYEDNTRQYLNDDSNYISSSDTRDRLQQKEGSILTPLLKLGAAAAGAYGAYRSGLLKAPLGFLTKGAGQYRSRYVEGPVSGIKRWVNNFGAKNNKTLKEEISDEMTRLAEKQSDELHGKASEFESLLLEKERTLRQVEETAKTELRYNETMAYLREEMSEDGIGQLEEELRTGPSGMRQLLNDAELDQRLNEKLGQSDYDAFLNRPDYSSGTSELEQEIIDKNRRFIEEQYEKELNEKFLSTTNKTEQTTGLNKLTVRDIYERRLAQNQGQIETKRGMEEFNVYDEIERLAAKNEDVWEMSAGKGLLKDSSDGIVDLRDIGQTAGKVMNSLTYDFKIPFVNFNPLQMLHLQDISMKRNAPSFSILSAGQKQPIVSSEALNESLVYAGGSVQRILSPDSGPIATDTYLTSNRFGMMSRITNELAGDSIVERPKRNGLKGFLDKVKNTFDIFQQDRASIFGEYKSVFSKFDDDDWIRNKTEALVSSNDFEKASKSVEDVRSFLDQHASGFRDEVWDALDEEVNKVFHDLEDFDLRDDDQVIDVIKRLATDSNVQVSDKYRSRIKATWNKYAKNPEQFKKGKRILSNQSAVDRLHNTKVISNVDDARKLIAKEFIYRNGTKSSVDLVSKLDSLKTAKKITVGGYRDAVETINSTVFDDLSLPGMNQTKQDAIRQTVNFYRSSGKRAKIHRQNLIDIVDSKTRPWQKGPSANFGNMPSSDWLLMNKAVSPKKAIKSKENASKFVQQFIAGRKNMKDVTTATTVPFYMFERLNSGLAMFGLGLSGRSMSSPQAMYGNLITKRVLPVVGLIGAAKYASYEYEKATGEGLDDEAADFGARVKLDVAKLRDATGATSVFQRIDQLTPGSEHLSEIPGPNFFDFTKTEEEVKEDLISGRDPVRKGRYWPFGNTPFTGGSIEYYQPNWYRRTKSDYKYTDVQYGSKDEYWENAAVPTPRYPLAPVRHFVTDPYHYEKKHYEDRPYPMTGKMGYEIPLIGPAVSATIGEILKPQRKMHVEDMQYSEGTQEGTSTNTVKSTKKGTDKVTGKYVQKPEKSSVPEGEELYYVPPSSMPTKKRVISQGELNIEEINKQIKEDAKKKNFITMRPKFDDNEVEVAAAEPGSKNSAKYISSELYYRASEMAGFYGFGISELTGQGGIEEPVLATADDMNSYRRAFWDMNLGGLGGELSEITRRFIPNRPYAQKEAQINPIRNKMPNWMPGSDYFVNFKQGDPFTKVPKGEMRLPGEGYESINELHPDKYGEKYGSFDRFKILADVAPYSQEYEYYKEIIEKDDDLPSDLKKRAAQIKREVTQKKKKRRFFPYRFKTANIKKEEVTVSKFLDSNNFMTEEYPDTPIRLAGLYVSTAKDSEKAQKAKDYISKRIEEGKNVTIGINEDKLNRVRDDTYGTMHAVVYVDGENLNRELLERDLAKEKDSDYSPEAVHARFSGAEIAAGKAWETFAHMDTPAHTKFLQTRSPLESYKRRDVYGKDWQSWSDPVEDFLVPTYESFINKHPAKAVVSGALLGSLFGRTRRGKVIGSLVGALTVGIGALTRSTKEQLSGEKWIPERIEKRREINKYFDILEYVKYKGLYEKTVDKAKEKNIDVEKRINEYAQSSEKLKEEKSKLVREKRELYRKGTSKAKEEISKINKRLKELALERKEIVELDEYTAQALEYREKYKSTLHGADLGGSLQKIFGAIPNPERRYFSEFLEAPEEERDEIEELVPDNVRRFLQAHWGKTPDEKESLKSYFKKYKLPDKNWEGWEADTELEDIKIKVVQSEGEDTLEYGYWDDDIEQATLRGAEPVDYEEDTPDADLTTRLQSVLEGEGINDLVIEVNGDRTGGDLVQIDLKKDRRQEIKDRLNQEGISF